MKNWQVLYGLDEVRYFETSEQAVHFAVWELAKNNISYSISPVWQGGNTV